MIAYKTNSAEYLDYVASTLTREQIQNDPDLCVFLENEYIKDNMEIAIRYNASKYGDYQDKYDFVEYLVCNGPELDADSLLHYRDKVYNDPVCLEIAYSYLSDIDTIKDIRDKKYNKKVDDCFSNPCFYLGKFSAVMGSTGDSENTLSIFSVMANKLHSKSYEIRLQNIANKFDIGQIGEDEYRKESFKILEEGLSEGYFDKTTFQIRYNSISNLTTGDETVKANDNREMNQIMSRVPDNIVRPTEINGASEKTWYGVISEHFKGVIPPSIDKGWLMMGKQILENNNEFTDEILVNNTKCLWNATMVSDWMSYPFAKTIDLISKANVNRHLGDCARMWSQVRNLRLFSYENQFGTITADQIVGNFNVNGVQDPPVANSDPEAQDASGTIESGADMSAWAAAWEEAAPMSEMSVADGEIPPWLLEGNDVAAGGITQWVPADDATAEEVETE